jgi:hypothetical protein
MPNRYYQGPPSDRKLEPWVPPVFTPAKRSSPLQPSVQPVNTSDRLENETDTQPKRMPTMNLSKLLTLGSLSAALMLPGLPAGAQSSTTTTTQTSPAGDSTSQTTDTTATPLTKSEKKAQKKSQKHAEKASSEKAKAAKDSANEQKNAASQQKHDDSATREQEAAQPH